MLSPAELSPAEAALTAGSIEAVQCPDGLIPWFEGGHADPWNHVEAAMALASAGRIAAATAAYSWLAAHQRADGAWHQYYRPPPPGSHWPATVEVAILDANVCAYVATGVRHHWLTTADRGFLETMWLVVERAVSFVLGLQRPGGEVTWARHPDGTPWSFALLTASSSTYHSLGSALEVAAALGRERPVWAAARAALGEAIRRRPGSFLPKDRWSMDWYYPVLSGAIGGEGAGRRLDRDRGRFVMEGLGVRCVDDRPWVTAAETAECAIAHLAAGRPAEAAHLLAWTRHLRAGDGSYFTGMVHPDRVHFPGGERSTYSAAAVVLASAALAEPGGATAAVFSPAGAGEPSLR